MGRMYRPSSLDKSPAFVYIDAVALLAIAFDIDGTLYPDIALRSRVLPFGLRNLRFLLALAAARDELHRRAASPRRDAGTPRDLSSFRDLQAELVGKRLGWPMEMARAHAEATVYGELEENFFRLPLFAGVIACLEAFKKSGLKLAVLSDFPARRKLEILGLAAYFDILLSSEESGLLKPAKEPFLALTRGLGTSPGETLYVGNSLRYDVAGAKAAGMPVAWRRSRIRAVFESGSRPGHGGPDFAFASWLDLKDYVLTRTRRSR